MPVSPEEQIAALEHALERSQQAGRFEVTRTEHWKRKESQQVVLRD